MYKSSDFFVLFALCFFLIVFLSEKRIPFFSDFKGNTYSLLNQSFKYISPEMFIVHVTSTHFATVR